MSLPVNAIFVAAIAYVAITAGRDSGGAVRIDVDGPLPALLIFLPLVSWVANVAVGVRRLHDRGRSGAWLILYYLVPAAVLQWLGSSSHQGSNRASALVFVVFAIFLSALVDLGMLAGQEGANRFGPDPRGRVKADVFD